MLAACDADPTSPGAPAFVSIEEPTPGVTVARNLTVELDRAGSVTVSYAAPGQPSLLLESVGPATEHAFDLVRLRSATTYEVEVTAVGTDGSDGPARDFTFTTDPLPAQLAALDFDVSGTPTHPLTILEITSPELDGTPVIVDEDGEIVWYREGSADLLHGMAPLPDGRGFAINTSEEVVIVGPGQLVEAELTEGQAAARTGLGTFNIHHDVISAGGTELLLLVHDTGTVSDTVWTGEAIWRWDWDSDALTKLWSSFDHWSPVDHRGDRTESWDWLHANALRFGPRGNLLISNFWTHEVASISSDFASIEWVLGGPQSTFAVADGAMDAGQHTAIEVETDRVLLFDNGLDRPGGAQFSRAIEVELDRVAEAAEVVWEFRPDPDIFAPIVGSTERLPNGNTFVAFGTSQGFSGLPATGPIVVYEVDPAGQVVWQLEIEGAALLYRATPLAAIGTERVSTEAMSAMEGR